MSPRRRSLLAICSIGLGLMICAAPADASRKATAEQRVRLADAIHTTPVAGIGEIPTRRYLIRNARVSSASKSWAAALLVGRGKFRTRFQPAEVLAVRLAGTPQWVVVDAGTSGVGCGIAPADVLADLFAEGTCPP
jgi:hypothetical protein